MWGWGKTHPLQTLSSLASKLACLLQWIQGYHRHCYRWQWWSFCWAAKCCVCVVELRFSDAQWKKNLRGRSVRGRRRQGRSKSFQVILPVFFSQIGVLDGTGTGLTINTAHHLVKHWVCHLRCWMDSTEGLWGLGNANSNAGSWWSQRVDIQEKAEYIPSKRRDAFQIHALYITGANLGWWWVRAREATLGFEMVWEK